MKGPLFNFYGRRQGRALKPRLQALKETLLPKILWSPESHLPSGPKVLEIGFGGGEHLAHQALSYRDTFFIGSEPFMNGVGRFLELVEQNNLENVRVFPDDVRYILPTFPEGSFDKIFVLFPDPWPKKRHWDRRIVNPNNLSQWVRILKPCGELRIGSDDPAYVASIIETLEDWKDYLDPQHTPTTILQKEVIWEPNLPITKFEEKAIKAGRFGTFMKYIRTPKSHSPEHLPPARSIDL
jgi:tRNA (guanine-N7-)-methyltransferase